MQLQILLLPFSSKYFSTGSTSMLSVAICSSFNGSGKGKTFSCKQKYMIIIIMLTIILIIIVFDIVAATNTINIDQYNISGLGSRVGAQW